MESNFNNSPAANEDDPMLDRGNITVVSHVLIRDRDTGEILVNQRDSIFTRRYLKDNNEQHPFR